MKRPPNEETWGRGEARQRYADGGNVYALPMSPAKAADALTRLKNAGHENVVRPDQAEMFGADKLQKLGAPHDHPAPGWKNRGGRTK